MRPKPSPLDKRFVPTILKLAHLKEDGKILETEYDRAYCQVYFDDDYTYADELIEKRSYE